MRVSGALFDAGQLLAAPARRMLVGAASIEASREGAHTAMIPRTNTIRRIRMKYVLSWFERPQGSPIEYENAQKRILDVFGQWKAPANFKIDFFVIRVGEWGGHMLVDCDDPVTVHKFCSMLPAFVFEARPVITVEEAVRGELEVIAWRDGLKRT